jgi:hypothetical protein
VLKKIDMEQLKAASLENRLRQAAPPERDRAQGLVPFAVKLNGELVKKLHAIAQERQATLDAVVAELLERSLEK